MTFTIRRTLFFLCIGFVLVIKESGQTSKSQLSARRLRRDCSYDDRLKSWSTENKAFPSDGLRRISYDSICNRTVNLSDTSIPLPVKKGARFILTSSACLSHSKLWACEVHPETDPFANARWSSCAVVGSSSSMLSSGIGFEIDAHEAVFRMNAAPILGFQNDVGSKTTLRLSFPPICGSTAAYAYEETHVCLRASNNAKLYEMYLHMRDAFYLVNADYAANAKAAGLPEPVRPGFYAAAPEFIEAGVNFIHGSPTSGLSAILFAMSHCDHVSVYGFTAGMLKTSDQSQIARFHYFIDRRVPNIVSKSSHSFEKEGNFLAYAHRHKLIYHWDAEGKD